MSGFRHHNRHIQNALDALPGYTLAAWRARETAMHPRTWHAALREGRIHGIYHNEKVWMVPRGATLPKPLPTSTEVGGERRHRCGSCFQYKPIDAFYETDAPTARQGGRCRTCKRQGQSATGKSARDPLFRAVYANALRNDQEIIAERRKTGMEPTESMILAHAARVAADGEAGDGEDWHEC